MAEWGVHDWTDGAMCSCPHRAVFIIDAVGHPRDGEPACENCGGLIP